MVRTSTAVKYGFECPCCHQKLEDDRSNKGFVSHKTSGPNGIKCLFEQGERDGKPIDFECGDNDVEIGGYSERGIVNALFYDIAFSEKALALLADFLNILTLFPDNNLKEYINHFHTITDAKILIEQSLSDFGDPDVILLLSGGDGKDNSPIWKCAIFIEAKVSTSQGSQWSIKKEGDLVKPTERNKINSSNLFIQLHHKAIFAKSLNNPDITIEYLQTDGVKFPELSTKTCRKLGLNPTVKEAVIKIKSYISDLAPLFIAIVPVNYDDMNNFLNDPGNRINIDMKKLFDPIAPWSTKGWGYITWLQIEKFCSNNNLKNAMHVFNVNRKQILGTQP
jgi:hypothetical protein